MLDALHQAHVRKICVNAGDKPYVRRPIAQITGEKLALLLPFPGGAGPALLQDGPPFAGQPVSGTVL